MKIGLALSGGGTKGLAHIGVIKVLEKNQIPIDFIAGTSAGAIIGGIYASGTPIKDIEKKIMEMKSRDFLGFILDLSKPQGGIVKAEKIMSFVESLISKRMIEEFKIPFAAISADIRNFKEVVIDKGDALTAIRASIAYPGLVKPVKINDMILVDGGIVNNLPMDVVKERGSDIVIGVKFEDFTREFKLNYKNVVWRSIKMMESCLTCLKIKNIENSILITPNIKGISTFSISQKLARLSIRRGESAAKKEIPRIKEMINNLG
ncbi:MAG: patatin-like phospholipase family protein [Candidatus Aenigmatarchaeota archaeon]|nr:patatin-like phospholipase family protein [Candidatus Aenigmarchaeota archaeon]